MNLDALAPSHSPDAERFLAAGYPLISNLDRIWTSERCRAATISLDAPAPLPPSGWSPGGLPGDRHRSRARAPALARPLAPGVRADRRSAGRAVPRRPA